jgi:hypothetical protein
MMKQAVSRCTRAAPRSVAVLHTLAAMFLGCVNEVSQRIQESRLYHACALMRTEQRLRQNVERRGLTLALAGDLGTAAFATSPAVAASSSEASMAARSSASSAAVCARSHADIACSTCSGLVLVSWAACVLGGSDSRTGWVCGQHDEMAGGCLSTALSHRADMLQSDVAR